MEARRSCENPRDALEAIHTFHVLREKRERTGILAPGEASTLAFTRDLFEPPRVMSFGGYRDPIKLAVRRTGLVSAYGDCQVVDIVGLALRQVEVVLRREVPIGTRVSLAIAGSDEGDWFRYRGRMVSRDPGTNRATIILLKPIE
jgi:hypothetical protein